MTTLAKVLAGRLLPLGKHLHDHLRAGHPLVFLHEQLKLTVVAASNPNAFELTDFSPQFPPAFLALVTEDDLRALDRDPDQEITVPVLDRLMQPIGEIGINGSIWHTIPTEAGGLGVAISTVLITALRQGDIFAVSAKNEKSQWQLYRALKDAAAGGLVRIEQLNPEWTAADRRADQKEKPCFDSGPDLVVLRVVNPQEVLDVLGRESIAAS